MIVAVLDDYQVVALELADWTRLGSDVHCIAYTDRCEDEDALVARLEGAAVVVAMRERTPFSRSLLERLPELRLLVTTAMGNAVIDLDAARELGIVVSGTRLANAQTIELTWALLMALVRDIPAHDRSVREGGWQLGLGRELRGSVLGIVGLGGIGRELARLGTAFGMHVVAWGRSLTPESAAEAAVEAVGFDEVFELADMVFIALRLSDETRGIVGERQLAALGERGYLVNTSRGPIVEEAALIAALHRGTIAGAALDVFDREPLPRDHPLRHAPRTVLTPHIGFVAEAAYRECYRDAVDDIIAWLAGSPLRVLNA